MCCAKNRVNAVVRRANLCCEYADGTKPYPIDSKPLYRLYNNASAPGKNYVSNHRYVIERADLAAAVAQGWVDEGQVMCVPQ